MLKPGKYSFHQTTNQQQHHWSTEQQTNYNKLTWRPKKRKQGHWLHALCIKVCLAYERTPTRATVVKHCRRPNCLNGDILPSIIHLWSGNPLHCLENPNCILLTLKVCFLLECRKYKRKWKISFQTRFLELFWLRFSLGNLVVGLGYALWFRVILWTTSFTNPNQ